MDLSGKRLCCVTGSCPWTKFRDTFFKEFVPLDFRDMTKDTTRISVSLIVSLSCPLWCPWAARNGFQIFGQVSESCLWIVSLKVKMSTNDTMGATTRSVEGHDRVVSFNWVPSSSSSSIEGNPQLGLDYPVEDPPPGVHLASEGAIYSLF